MILVKRSPPGENDSEVHDFLRCQNELRFNPAQLVLGKLSYLEDVQAFVRHIGFTDEARQDPALALRSREAMQAILRVVEHEKKEHHEVLVCIF